MPVSSPLMPGTVSPRRPVPSSIARPEYVDRPTPERFTGSEVKDAETIERMRAAGRVAARALAAGAAVIAPGVTTLELDAAADEGGVDLVGVAVQRDRRGLGHRAVLGPQERLTQLRRRRDRRAASP